MGLGLIVLGESASFSLWNVKILTVFVASIDEIYRELHGIGLERIKHIGRYLLHNLGEK